MTAAYVYRCYGADDRLLYVGQSVSPDLRIRVHRLQTPWGHLIARTEQVEYPSAGEARAAEREAIRTESPRFNTQGRFETHPTWTREQFDDYIALIEWRKGAGSDYVHLTTVRRLRDARFPAVTA